MEELDIAIARQEKHVQKLRAAVEKLQEAEADLAAMMRTRELLTKGKTEGQQLVSSANLTPQKSGLTVIDAVEQILRTVPEMHVNDLVPRLVELGVHTTKASLTSTLAKYVTKGRFKRTKANTFALADAPVESPLLEQGEQEKQDDIVFH